MTDTLTPDMTIADVVNMHIHAADVFQQYGIDFCCGGKRKLETACTSAGVDWNILANALSVAMETPDTRSQHMNHLEPDLLVAYIEQTHHRYLREQFPLLQLYLGKVLAKHGERHPELKIVEKQVRLLAEDLEEHMRKEERILFPYILQMCAAARAGKPMPQSPFGTVANPIHVMEYEHDYAGSLIDNIRAVTNNFTPPQDACTTYRLAYEKIKEIDNDLRWHVHLENNVLFPKTLALETTNL